MRIVAIIVLFCLMTGMSAPLCVVVKDTPDDGKQYLMTLDLCHKAHSVFSASPTGPFIACQDCRPVPAAGTGFEPDARTEITPLLLVYPKEHPPRA